jgi:hypothetical protein
MTSTMNFDLLDDLACAGRSSVGRDGKMGVCAQSSSECVVVVVALRIFGCYSGILDTGWTVNFDVSTVRRINPSCLYLLSNRQQ